MAQKTGYVTKTVKTSDIDVYQDLSAILSVVDRTLYVNAKTLHKPSDATLLFFKEPLKNTDLMALKLCAQCLAQENSSTSDYIFTHTYLNSSLLNTQITHSSATATATPGLANTAYGARCFLQLTKLIDERLSVLKDFIPNSSSLQVRQPNVRRAMLFLIKEYLPRVFETQLQNFNYLVNHVELSNLVSTLNNLGKLLTYLSANLSFQFSTVNAAFSMLTDATNPVYQFYLDCLDPLFSSETSSYVDWIEKLYDYLVGHELTRGMCTLLELKLKTRLLKLIDISNSSEHRNFFRQLLASVETHCTSSIDLSCEDRMETCKNIMNDLGQLHFVLVTGKLPYRSEMLIRSDRLTVVPSTAEALLNMLDMAEVSYIQLRAPKELGLIGRLMRRITQFVDTHSTLLSLLLAAALLYQNLTYVPSEKISEHLYRRGLDANNLENLDYPNSIFPNSDPKYVSMCSRRPGHKGYISSCKLFLNDLNITREYPEKKGWFYGGGKKKEHSKRKTNVYVCQHSNCDTAANI